MSERITVDCPECGFKVLVLEDQRRGYCLQHRGMFWVSDAIIKDLQAAKQQAEQALEQAKADTTAAFDIIHKRQREIVYWVNQLNKYGKHLPTCQHPEKPCDCGFEEHRPAIENCAKSKAQLQAATADKEGDGRG